MTRATVVRPLSNVARRDAHRDVIDPESVPKEIKAV
jgi:hypothetical protein